MISFIPKFAHICITVINIFYPFFHEKQQAMLKLFLVVLFTNITVGTETTGDELCLSILAQVFNSTFSPTSPAKGYNEGKDI